MAKGKKTKRKKARRVGAMSLNPNSTMMKVGAVVLGYFLGDTVNSPIDTALKSVFPTTTAAVTTPATATPATTAAAAVSVSNIAGNNKIVAGVEVGLGALLLLSKKGSWVKTVAGGVAAGAGLARGLKAFGVVTGYQSTPVLAGRVRGYQSMPALGGVPPQLSGVPPQLSGYRVNGGMRNGYAPNGSGMGVLAGMGILADN